MQTPTTTDRTGIVERIVATARNATHERPFVYGTTGPELRLLYTSVAARNVAADTLAAVGYRVDRAPIKFPGRPEVRPGLFVTVARPGQPAPSALDLCNACDVEDAHVGCTMGYCTGCCPADGMEHA